MGITGLIPFLDKASSRIHLKELRGSTVAIDSYCWLHKGVYTCAEKLARGEDTDLYINYCLKYVQMLLSFDIKPILVFDGMHLPAKAITEKRRREQRRESKKRATELLRLGKIEEARSHMRRCVDVTHEMALRLIREMRIRNVDCIVAPYEADAQMAWLNKAGIAQYVITEDSDLTLFGAQKIIFKLDLSGNGLLVESEKIYLSMGCSKERYKFEKFRRMCILSGCDYLDSLQGIGLAKACKFMLKTEQEDMLIALKKIPYYLNMKQLQVDDDYIENFLKAEATFKHMFIYNPIKRQMERLHDLSEFETDERYCTNAGKLIENNEIALNLALGNLNPFTLKQLDTWHPDKLSLNQAPPKNIKRAKHKSIWQGSFTSNSPSKNKQRKNITENCALYFKNVDFISRTIENDINASLSEENAKPAEIDVFKMYKNEVDDEGNEPEHKRRRLRSELNVDLSPKITHHNPFAKAFLKNETTENDCTKLPAICANSSLLKVLSPKKCKSDTERISNFKRNIFVKEDKNKIEIRSRFFADNIKLVKESKKTTTKITQFKLNTPKNNEEAIMRFDSPPDLSDEIEKFERLSQQEANKLNLLYNSPSPVKLRNKDIPLSHTDSGIESLKAIDDDLGKGLIHTPIQSIDISDEEDNAQNKDYKKNITTSNYGISNDNKKTNTSNKLDAFKSKTGPRIGLSKSKALIKKTKSIGNSSQSQTRLSMFGFQKRPNLK